MEKNFEIKLNDYQLLKVEKYRKLLPKNYIYPKILKDEKKLLNNNSFICVESRKWRKVSQI